MFDGALGAGLDTCTAFCALVDIGCRGLLVLQNEYFRGTDIHALTVTITSIMVDLDGDSQRITLIGHYYHNEPPL